MLNNTSVTLADAVVAMERNLQTILALTGRKGTVKAKVDAYATTASVAMRLSPDGKVYDAVVTFPVKRHDTRVTRHELDRWTGYLLHEVSHVLWTDDPAWRVAVAEGIGDLTNGLEDVRIEARTIAEAVAGNARERLVELLSWAVGETPDNFDPNDPRYLPWTLAMIGRVRVCGYDLPRVAKFAARLSPSMRRMVDGVMVELVAAKSTADVVAIARRLTAAAPKLPPVTLPPIDDDQPVTRRPGTSEAGESETGESEAGESEAGEAEAGEAEAGEAEAGESEAGESEAGESESESEAGEAEAGEAEAGESEAGESEAGESESESEAEAPKGGGGERGGGDGRVDDGETAGGFDPADMQPVPDLNPAEREEVGAPAQEAELVEAVADAVRKARRNVPTLAARSNTPIALREALAAAANGCSRLRTQIAAALKAPADDDWRRRLSAGRVDGRAMGRLAAGDYTGLFARRRPIDGFETEVAVLMDGSTSMHSQRLFVAATLAMAVTRATEQVGVKCEVTMFLHNTLKSIKTPVERLASPKVMERIWTAASTTGGFTPLSACLALVAERLTIRAQGKRKIVFCVTDGGCDLGPYAVKAVAERCEARGVEVIGLSIDSRVHGVFPHEVRVASTDDVAQVGLGILARVLADRGRAA